MAISRLQGNGGLSLYTLTPCRVLDTRQNNGQPFVGEKTVDVMGSICGPSSNAQAYVFNGNSRGRRWSDALSDLVA